MKNKILLTMTLLLPILLYNALAFVFPAKIHHSALQILIKNLLRKTRNVHMCLSNIIIRYVLGFPTIKDVIEYHSENFCVRIRNVNNATTAGIPDYTAGIPDIFGQNNNTLKQ